MYDILKRMIFLIIGEETRERSEWIILIIGDERRERLKKFATEAAAGRITRQSLKFKCPNFPWVTSTALCRKIKAENTGQIKKHHINIASSLFSVS